MRRVPVLGALAALMVVLSLSTDVHARASTGFPRVQFNETSSGWSLSNGFIKLKFDAMKGVTGLFGNFEGTADFSRAKNLVSSPCGVAVQLQRSNLRWSSSCNARRRLPYRVLSHSPTSTSVQVQDVLADPSNNVTTTSFTFTLAQDERAMDVVVESEMTAEAAVSGLVLGLYFTPRSSYLETDKGVVQMMESQQPHFALNGTIERLYALGNVGSVDVQFTRVTTRDTLLVAGIWDSMYSGVQLVYAGSTPQFGTWTTGWNNQTTQSVPSGRSWTTSFSISANQYNFPPSSVPADVSGMNVTAVRALLTSVYGSPVGGLVSYEQYPIGMIAPCVGHHGGRCYDSKFNFWDPDSFLHISSLMYAFDPYLTNEARKIIVTSALGVCTEAKSWCRQGQVPHHFLASFMCPSNWQSAYCVCNVTKALGVPANLCRAYVSLSNTDQSGPNVFFLLATLRYLGISGDYALLKELTPKLRLALNYLLALYDTEYHMLSAPGPLWIDTFIRVNFTSDTNSAMVMVLDEMADMELFLGNSTGAAKLHVIASNISTAMNTYLWAGDHFVTQGSRTKPVGSYPPNGPPPPVDSLIRVDMVDFDSNLLAVAAGVTSKARSEAIYSKIATYDCAHSRPTWVSGVYYNETMCNNLNTGDSAVDMGRIGQRSGGAASMEAIQSTIIDPVMTDLFANTFLFERYNCDESPTHNAFFLEYPEMMSMVLVEVQYGLHFGLTHIDVKPMRDEPYVLSIANLHVEYSTTAFVFRLANVSGYKTFTVAPMQPGTYHASTGAATTSAVVGADNILTFQIEVTEGSTVTASLVAPA